MTKEEELKEANDKVSKLNKEIQLEKIKKVEEKYLNKYFIHGGTMFKVINVIDITNKYMYFNITGLSICLDNPFIYTDLTMNFRPFESLNEITDQNFKEHCNKVIEKLNKMII